MSESMEGLVEFLNEAVACDRDAIKSLIECRVPCNEAMRDHETIQVACKIGEDDAVVGLLGVLNGFAGRNRATIVAHYDENDALFKFSLGRKID